MNKEIVIVDDNPINLKLLESALEDSFELRLFTNPKQALLSIIEKKPDLIILDIKMPEINGFEACKQIKNNENLADIPVIFLSANNDKETKEQALNSGGVDYIEKPFKLEEVKLKIIYHLN